MKAFLIHPQLTVDGNEHAQIFADACLKELNRHVEAVSLTAEPALLVSRPQHSDVILLFNRTDQNYAEVINIFLSRAVDTGCKILPIGIGSAHRSPPTVVAQSQSFDVTEQLRQRKMTPQQLPTVALALAREVISHLQPTMSRENMVLFLSYRRRDGEVVCGAFYDELALRMQNRFRDLNNVLVGMEAQAEIITNLKKSDAVVFLDTPRSGESDWVALELTTALSMNIPIVWVRIGADSTNRIPLKVRPMQTPHLCWEDIGAETTSLSPTLVDKVIHSAFEISREHSLVVLSQVEHLRNLHRLGHIRLSELDARMMTYHVEVQRAGGYRYRQRPMTHIVGIYGRQPSQADQREFLEKIAQHGYVPHPRYQNLHYYDAALILAPVAPQGDGDIVDVAETESIVDSCSEYVASLESYLRHVDSGDSSHGKSVIISGAFPDCEPEFQQRLTEAVHAFTQAILDRGANVIFGAHPTFQHLILDMAKRRRKDYRDCVHMYVSKYFVPDSLINETRQYARVTATDVANSDRAKSLTTMRQAMIDDPEAVCLVAMGGKTNRPDILPGIDEEIKLARRRGLPVFVVGSVGGRTAEIATEMDAAGWSDCPNAQTKDFNRDLMLDTDYNVLANKILDSVSL